MGLTATGSEGGFDNEMRAFDNATSGLSASDLDIHAPYCSPTRALGDRSFMVGNSEGPGGAVVAEGHDLFTCGQRDPPKK